MAKAGVEIFGMEKLEAVLSGLPVELQKNVLSQATSAEGEKVRKAARANLQAGNAPPEVIGTIKKWKAKSRMGRIGYWIGPKREKSGYFFPSKATKRGGYKGKAFAAAAPLWYEWGTYTGERIKPLHYMEKAVDSTIGQIEASFRQTLANKINRFLDRYATGKAGKTIASAAKRMVR